MSREDRIKRDKETEKEIKKKVDGVKPEKQNTSKDYGSPRKFNSDVVKAVMKRCDKYGHEIFRVSQQSKLSSIHF